MAIWHSSDLVSRSTVIAIMGWLSLAAIVAAQPTGKIEIELVDEKTGESIPCRIRLTGPTGKPLRVRGAPFQNGWNMVASPLKFEGKAGDYQYEAFHGPRYSRAQGGFTLDKKSSAIDVLKLPAHCDLDAEGWKAGDLLSPLTPQDLIPWLAAEDLVMATSFANANPASGPANKQAIAPESMWVEEHGFHHPASGLSLHHWLPPREVPEWVPSSRLLAMAQENPQTFIEIQRPWATDVPLWLASNQVDGIQLLSEHLTLDGQGGTVNIAPPIELDRKYPAGQRGTGRMVEQLYWRILETGMRIPPTAGSGFGKTGAPLGYNRVYALSPSLSERAWWDALRAGNCFATNGPLLRTRVNGLPPGHVFQTTDPISLEIAVTLTVADPVEYLDVVFNGQAIYQARLDEHAKRGGKIPTLEIKESGWLVVRVVTEREFTYRMATTAPFYFEFHGRPRISRKAVKSMQSWLDKAIEQLNRASEQTQKSAQPYVDSARQFWATRLEMANAD